MPEAFDLIAQYGSAPRRPYLLEGIVELTNAINDDADFAAGFHGAHTDGSAAGNDVAHFERQVL